MTTICGKNLMNEIVSMAAALILAIGFGKG